MVGVYPQGVGQSPAAADPHSQYRCIQEVHGPHTGSTMQGRDTSIRKMIKVEDNVFPFLVEGLCEGGI